MSQNCRCCLESREWRSEDERETLQLEMKGPGAGELEEARQIQEVGTWRGAGKQWQRTQDAAGKTSTKTPLLLMPTIGIQSRAT